MESVKKVKSKIYLTVIKRNKFAIITTIFLMWFIISFLIIPNINVILDSFIVNDNFSLDGIKRLFRSEYAISSIKNSIILAISISITTNVVGIFTVLVSDYFEIKGSKLLKAGYMTTFVYGGIILVGGYLAIYGRNGIITRALIHIFPTMNEGWFSGYWGVLFVSTFAGTTTHFLFLSNAIQSIDNYLIEAARNMKASTMYIITKVLLPILLPVL